MKQYAWKVTFKFYNYFISCCEVGERQVSYEVNKWTVPNKQCPPLFVFKTKKDAIKYKNHSNFHVHKAEVKFVKRPSYFKKNITLPPGTRFASAVKLIE